MKTEFVRGRKEVKNDFVLGMHMFILEDKYK